MKLSIASKAGFRSLNQIPAIKQLFGFKLPKSNNKEFQSAVITIHLILDSGLIKIRNTGQADANNMKILLDGISVKNYPGIINKKNQTTIPAQKSIVIQACVGFEVFPSEFIEIIWDDPEKDKKSYRISLQD